VLDIGNYWLLLPSIEYKHKHHCAKMAAWMDQDVIWNWDSYRSKQHCVNLGYGAIMERVTSPEAYVAVLLDWQ